MSTPTHDLARTASTTVIPLDAIDVLPWERPRDPEQAGVPLSTLERLGGRLEDFATGLSEREQAALYGLLRAASGDAPLDVLGAEPPEAVLSPDEIAVFEALRDEPPPAGPALRPFLVLVMKATRLCNLRCTYCHFWRAGPNQIMRFPVLARTIRDALRAPGVTSVDFAWHGGEVTLLPPAFFRKALWLQQQFRRPGQTVTNSVQTNGTHVTDDWIAFIRRYQISVGVSLDGPPEVHDQRRLDAAGKPTSARVRAGLARLRDAGISHGVLMVVDEAIIALGAERLLEYLLDLDVRGVALLNVIPENAPSGPGAESYLPWSRFVTFLRELHRLWWPRYADRLVLRELADLTGKVAGRPAGTCFFAGDCFGVYLTIEPNGDVAACDKYIDDEAYRYGSLLQSSLTEIAGSPRVAAMRAANQAAVDQAKGCRWFNVCQGACPHDRYLRERRMPGADESCCGLAPLLDDIAARLHEPAGRAIHSGGASTTEGVPPRR
jgi:uncharacterized protein